VRQGGLRALEWGTDDATRNALPGAHLCHFPPLPLSTVGCFTRAGAPTQCSCDAMAKCSGPNEGPAKDEDTAGLHFDGNFQLVERIALGARAVLRLLSSFAPNSVRFPADSGRS
jgi:hypothetical protein